MISLAWQGCLEAFLASIESISGSVRSRTVYAYTLRAFFSDATKLPDAYSRGDVQRFIDSPSRLKYRLGEPVTAGTKNQRMMVLNSFYKFAATYEVDGEPILQGKPPSYGIRYLKPSSSPHALTAKDIETFFSAIDTTSARGVRDRAIFLTYLLTAKRRSEISRLTVGDIREAIFVDKDGSRRPGHVFQYRAKGRSRIISTAELPPLAYDAIVQYWRISGRLGTLTPADPVFASTRPDQPNQQITGGYINILCKQYCAKAGLSREISLHAFRHTSARLRYELGSDVRDIQEVLGHTNLGTTTLYLRSLNGASDTGARLLESRFSGL